MDNYYKEFPDDIRQDMSAEEIRQVLNGLYARVAGRHDSISVEKQVKYKAVLEVFRDEESKRAYDQALAESGREPPEVNPRQKEQQKWFLSAVDSFKDKDYDLAKAAMNRALEQGKDLFDASQYHTAALVYAEAEEYAPAIDCINEALLLEPQNIEHMVVKGTIYGYNAWRLARDSRFSSLPELQREYRELRAKELDQLKKACERASSDEERGFALEGLAFAEYCSPNQVDKDQAEKDRLAGVQHIHDAQKLGQISSDAQKILEDFKIRCERRQRNAGQLNKLMESASEHIEKRKFDEAMLEIEEALKLDVDPNSRLYGLAADVYCWCDDFDAASKYIGMALTLEPENPYLIAVLGQLYGMRAWKTAKDSRFSSSPSLQKEYRALRKDELALLQDAVMRAKQSDNQYRIPVRGKAVWALYFRPHQIDTEEAKKDRIAGLRSTRFFYRANADARLVWDDYSGLISRAMDFYKTGEYGKAKLWIEKALELDEVGRDVQPNLYTLAAQIYFKNEEFDTAFRYIDKEIAQIVSPRSCHMISVGKLCGWEALDLAEDSRFSSSPELQKTYRVLRTKELALLNDACKLARAANGDAKGIASALGELAFAEYFRPDQLDKAQAERDRRAGVQHALEAEKVSPGCSKLASKVLEKNHEQERRKAEAEARERRRREEQEAEKRRRREEQEAKKRREKEEEKQLNDLIKAARSYYENQEYVQAKNTIVKALSMELNYYDDYLYLLAAQIYSANYELDAALGYVNKALARDSYNVYSIVTKAEIYGKKAQKIQENCIFNTSLGLQRDYSTFLAEERRLLEQAVAVAQELGLKKGQAYAMGCLAWVMFFRIDITQRVVNPHDYTTWTNTQQAAVKLAEEALKLGESREAQEVNDVNHEQLIRMFKGLGQAMRENEEDAKRWKKEMRRKGFLRRFF